MTDIAQDNDHAGLTDMFASRRYFAKFERITGHLNRVAAVMQAEGALRRDEVEILTTYVQGLSYTFRALSMKYLLVGRDTGRPVELGAIRIDLSLFEREPRDLILAGRRPLGTLLGDFRIPYTSRPRLFFRIRSDRRIDEHFGLEGPHLLYGRQNVLSGASGRPLAEVVEILPPVVELSAGDAGGAVRDAAAGELGTE